MLTTTDEGFYFSFIDDKDIVYTGKQFLSIILKKNND